MVLKHTVQHATPGLFQMATILCGLFLPLRASIHRWSRSPLFFPYWNTGFPSSWKKFRTATSWQPYFQVMAAYWKKASYISCRADPSELDVCAKISAVDRAIILPTLLCCLECSQNINAGNLQSMPFNVPASVREHRLEKRTCCYLWHERSWRPCSLGGYYVRLLHPSPALKPAVGWKTKLKQDTRNYKSLTTYHKHIIHLI